MSSLPYPLCPAHGPHAVRRTVETLWDTLSPFSSLLSGPSTQNVDQKVDRPLAPLASRYLHPNMISSLLGGTRWATRGTPLPFVLCPLVLCHALPPQRLTQYLPRDLHPRRLSESDDGSRESNGYIFHLSRPPPLPSLALLTPACQCFLFLCPFSQASSVLFPSPCLDRSIISHPRALGRLWQTSRLTSPRPCLTLPYPACPPPFNLKVDKLPLICCSESCASITPTLSLCIFSYHQAVGSSNSQSFFQSGTQPVHIPDPFSSLRPSLSQHHCADLHACCRPLLTLLPHTLVHACHYSKTHKPFGASVSHHRL